MRTLFHVIAWMLVVFTALAFAACGGGGGDAYTPAVINKDCAALQKVDGSQASCP